VGPDHEEQGLLPGVQSMRGEERGEAGAVGAMTLLQEVEERGAGHGGIGVMGSRQDSRLTIRLTDNFSRD
jgi:hypothetical protein